MTPTITSTPTTFEHGGFLQEAVLHASLGFQLLQFVLEEGESLLPPPDLLGPSLLGAAQFLQEELKRMVTDGNRW